MSFCEYSMRRVFTRWICLLPTEWNKYQSHQQRANKCENTGVYGISWHPFCLLINRSLFGRIAITTLNSIGRYNPGLKGKLTFSHDVHRRMRMPQYVKICLGYSKNCSPMTSLLLSLCKDSLLCTLLNQTFCHKLEVGRLHILSLQCHLMWG